MGTLTLSSILLRYGYQDLDNYFIQQNDPHRTLLTIGNTLTYEDIYPSVYQDIEYEYLTSSGHTITSVAQNQLTRSLEYVSRISFTLKIASNPEMTNALSISLGTYYTNEPDIGEVASYSDPTVLYASTEETFGDLINSKSIYMRLEAVYWGYIRHYQYTVYGYDLVADGYYDEEEGITITSDNILRFDAITPVKVYEDGNWDLRLMKVYHDGEWHFANARGMLSQLMDSSGEAIVDANNSQLYTVETEY